MDGRSKCMGRFRFFVFISIGLVFWLWIAAVCDAAYEVLKCSHLGLHSCHQSLVFGDRCSGRSSSQVEGSRETRRQLFAQLYHLRGGSTGRFRPRLGEAAHPGEFGLHEQLLELKLQLGEPRLELKSRFDGEVLRRIRVSSCTSSWSATSSAGRRQDERRPLACGRAARERRSDWAARLTSELRRVHGVQSCGCGASTRAKWNESSGSDQDVEVDVVLRGDPNLASDERRQNVADGLRARCKFIKLMIDRRGRGEGASRTDRRRRWTSPAQRLYTTNFRQRLQVFMAHRKAPRVFRERKRSEDTARTIVRLRGPFALKSRDLPDLAAEGPPYTAILAIWTPGGTGSGKLVEALAFASAATVSTANTIVAQNRREQVSPEKGILLLGVSSGTSQFAQKGMETQQWMDPYAATSSESMSDGTRGDCKFIHNQCGKELFTSEYLRSNKASGHKNLRCFPHCCGGHNPKSFCGSGLVVECYLSNCQLVLGRFEEVAKQQPVNNKTRVSPNMSTSVDTSLGRSSLTVGREYPRQELFDDVKMPDQPFGRWFRGTAVPNANGSVSTCFLLNGNRQSWHYGWQSSRLNCKNLHVFKVYIFDASASGNANTLTCLSALASPAFRISSSRKARKTFRSPMNQAATSAGPPMGIQMAVNRPGVASPPPSARSIDELLGSATGANAAAMFAAAQQQQPPTGFMSRPNLQRDPARRERKRLTRSASLKTDYFSTISFPTIQQQQQQFQQPQQQRLSLSATHPPHFEGLHENHQASTPSLPGVSSFLNNSAGPRPTGGNRAFHTRRSSLAALPVPASNPMNMQRQHQRPVPVLTPITGMMQLRLESHSPYTSTPIANSTPSSSSSTTSSSGSGAPPTHTRLTAAALHQHAYASARPYPYARRDTWSSSLQSMIPEGGGIPMMMMMSPGSSPDSYLNRKRNRSTDSDKAITAAIEASEKIHPTLSPISSPGCSPPMVAPVPTDSELYRRARILQLAFTIVKRIHRFEEVAAKHKEPNPKVYRHSFEMITPPMPTNPPSAAANQTARTQRNKCTLVQIPLSNPKLLYLCSNLVTVCTSLVSAGLLEDMRQKMHDCAQAGRGALAAYAKFVDLLNDSVEAQMTRLPRRMHKSWGDAESADEGEWDLYEMLKSCEPWLLQEPWWVLLDEDEKQQAGDKEEGALRPLPYMNVFADYYRAIREAVPSPQDLEVAASLRKAALTGATGLTGEWNRQGEPDEHHLQQPQRVASIRSASAASSLSWLARCIHAHTTKVFHVTETDTTMTLMLPNSLVSADAVFLLQLDQQEPTVVLPQDYFPFGWSRKRSVMAYRAWRVRGIGDSNGSAVAVQFMRWPDDNELEAVENDEEEELDDDEAEDSPEEPEEEPLGRRGRQPKRLRTRITIYFSVFSPSTLQLRSIVEASIAPAAALPASSTAQPTEADMLRYFKSPSSWEMRSQISQQYTKNL